MCAIIGALVSCRTDDDVRLATKLLNYICQASFERGRDGRGCVIANDDEYVVQKTTRRIEEGQPFGLGTVFRINKNGTFLANLRAEPTTEFVKNKNKEDQQPYRSGGWYVVHNGTIANDKELRSYGIPTSIDSAAIPETLLWNCARDFGAFVDVVKMLKGSYAILAHHNESPDRIFVAANYRPIWYANTSVGVFFASSRAYFPPGIPVEMVPPYSACEFSLGPEEGVVSIRHHSLYKPLQAPRALVVCSGGLDSVVAATQAQRGLGYDITLLHFTYGCRAETRETIAVQEVAKALGVGVLIKELPIWGEGDSPLLDSNSTIAGGELGAEFAHEWVPARNLVMLSVATAMAEAGGYDTIVLGNNLEEAGAYPDNEPEFINRFNAMLPFAVGDGKQVKVIMPVGNLMKHEIVKLGLELDAPMHLTWSCYRGGHKHCGTCGPCFMRKTAFEINGAVDPVFDSI